MAVPEELKKGSDGVPGTRTEKQLAHDKEFGGRMDPALQQRNRLGKAFISRMRADFEKNGIATIERVRKEKPEVYLNLVSRLVPQELNVNVQHTFTDVLMEAAKRYKDEKVVAEDIVNSTIEGELVE